MNLTVAKRIVFGFVIITLLLIVNGSISLSSFTKVEQSTQRATELAMNALVSSSRLQQQASTLAEEGLAAFYSGDTSEIEAHKKRILILEQDFRETLAGFDQLAKAEPQLAAPAKAVSATFQSLEGQLGQLLDAKLKAQALRKQLQGQLSEIEDLTDDTSTYLLDLYDSGIESGPQATANKVETALLSLGSTSVDYVKSETATKAETISGELSFILGDIKTNLDFLSRQLGDNDYLPDIRDGIEKLDALILTGSDSLVGGHQAELAELARARTALETERQNMATLGQQLDALQQAAKDIASDSRQQINDSVSSANSVTTLVIIVSVLVASAIAWWVVRSITVPLDRVNRMLNVIASGDLSKRLDDSAQDEFGLLARNTNSLINSLRSLIEGISQGSTQLAASAEQTSAITAQTRESIQQQKGQVHQVATATTEMSASADQVTHAAAETLESVRRADTEAERVRQLSADNKSTIQQLAAEVEAASQVINKLHQDSANIGSILDVIRGIAEQTNLLALNAAIEAARAGEQGRGFAVVADEVRTLASRTQQSTQEIQAMIEALQAGAEQAVAAMEQGQFQAESCVNKSEQADLALSHITEAVHDARDKSEHIAQAAQEQGVVAQEISANLDGIVGIAEETTEGAEQTAASSEQVARLAEELQQSVQRFRLS
ncbi:methyl-accepting chemotaxis protein [Gallaecimonas sp. GXIMD4217]|uniref:HAMP domain-containing methyl-accepting chemotaxis protein n=1 Tax=Gallaecimonas sp. GXIMD4217 TaxID=3131927 RepID=UPI00311B3630